MLDPQTVKEAVRSAYPTDEQVVERVLGGEAEFFELLMRRHNQRVYRAVRSVLRDEAEVEDVMQQAYLNAWANLKQFSGQSRVSTWLVRIAVNEALMRTRKASRLQLVEDLPPNMEATMNRPASSPEDRAQSRELSALLETAVDALPELYRTVFMLRNIENLSSAETAEVLGVSDDVVKTRLHRARRLIRNALFQRLSDGGKESFPFFAPRCDRVVSGVLEAIALIRG
jgi:RNA polymerase sigma-70 factor (ECF subfamily)